MPDVLLLREEEASGSSSLAETVAHLAETFIQLRNAIEQLLLASRSNKSQAQQWLISALGALAMMDRATRRRRFMQFLPGGAAHAPGPAHDAFCAALLGLLLESEPARVAALLSRQPGALRRFFRGSKQRAAAWFGHFSMGGMREFQHGAKALANYALAQRGEAWHLLEWRGRHPQAPVAVAQRPHYFCELDVAATVANLESECPAFWESEELRSCLAGGDVLRIDPAAWAEELGGWLRERSSRGNELHRLLCGWLEEGASWRALCARLLPLLPLQDLLRFADGLLEGGGYISGGGGSSGSNGSNGPAAAQPGTWLVLRGVRWPTLDDLQMASAAGCSQGPLLRLLREDDQEQQLSRVRQLAVALHAAPPAAHWQLRQERLERVQAEGREAAQRRRESRGREWEREGEGERPTPAAVELHRLLLLQLLAAGLAVQEAASSSDPGSAAALQQLLAESRVECEVVPGQAFSLVEDGGSGERRKRRRHSGSSRRKRQRKEERRRSKSSRRGSEHSDSSSEDEGGGKEAAAALASEAAADARWRVRWPGQASFDGAVLSTFELCDAVLRHAAASYAGWRFEGLQD